MILPDMEGPQAVAAGPGSQDKAALAGGFGILNKTRASSSKEPILLRRAFSIPTCDLAADDPNATTILRANERLTKLVLPRRAAVIPFNEKIKYYAATVVDVSTYELLRHLLRNLIPRWGCANVAGAILPTANRKRMRRLKDAKPEDDDGQPTFVDVARFVHAIDVDKLKARDGFDLHDVKAAAYRVRAALPIAFHNVRCVGMATSSYLLDPLKRELRFGCFASLARSLARS